MPRINVNKRPSVRTRRDQGSKAVKFQAPKEPVTQPVKVEVPDRMEVIFKDQALNRWLVLTPKEWNEHHCMMICLPVTIEKTHLDPFEYSFVLGRLSMIALLQPRTIALKPPYVAIGRLTRYDHQLISRQLFKLIGDPTIAINI